jgi:outer membrane protein TolC
MAVSDMKMARAGLFPSINASASHTSLAYQPSMVALGQTVNTSDTQYYAYSISIQQILFDFRGSLSRYDASRMLLEAQKHETSRIRNAIAMDFTQSFYEYLESQHLIETAAGEIERLETHLKNATRLYEVLIVDRTLDAVDFEITAHKAEFLPKFYVRGSNDYMENPYQRYENNWALMFGVNINLFEGGRTLANVQKSRSRQKQLIEQQKRLADEIRLELQHYSLNLQNAYARILVNQDAASQAQENLRINRKRYEEGMGTATEVLDAVTLLTLAETNHIRAIYDYRRAEAALHYATGRNLLDVYR